MAEPSKVFAMEMVALASEWKVGTWTVQPGFVFVWIFPAHILHILGDMYRDAVLLKVPAHLSFQKFWQIAGPILLHGDEDVSSVWRINIRNCSDKVDDCFFWFSARFIFFKVNWEKRVGLVLLWLSGLINTGQRAANEKTYVEVVMEVTAEKFRKRTNEIPVKLIGRDAVKHKFEYFWHHFV